MEVDEEEREVQGKTDDGVVSGQSFSSLSISEESKGKVDIRTIKSALMVMIRHSVVAVESHVIPFI